MLRKTIIASRGRPSPSPSPRARLMSVCLDTSPVLDGGGAGGGKGGGASLGVESTMTTERTPRVKKTGDEVRLPLVATCERAATEATVSLLEVEGG